MTGRDRPTIFADALGDGGDVRRRRRRLPASPSRWSGSSARPKRMRKATRTRSRPRGPGRSARTSPRAGRSVTEDRAGGISPGGGGFVAGERAQEPVGGPRHCRDGRDAQPLVDRRAFRVVDPRDDSLDTEGLPGHPGGDDIGIVPVGYRGERSASLDSGPINTSRSNPTPGHPLVRRKSLPRRRNADSVAIDRRRRRGRSRSGRGPMKSRLGRTP